ncbi:MAG: cyclic nucleotide-binding domain-containing protein, partial [Beijerinckiaceae bacterium]|nr:cyclic nucleotide-binding domain-containing protein [Beijerinckiaceae bacterium]
MATSSIRSITVRPRPLIISPGYGPDPCATCGARSESVCNAIDDPDLTRLASIAVVTEIEPGKTFIGEGDPAADFYNVTLGHVKLFKLLPDGRRQITGFAQAGVFLGLAGSATYSFSAEA